MQGQAVVGIVGGALVVDVACGVVGVRFNSFYTGRQIDRGALGDAVEVIVSIAQFGILCKYFFLDDSRQVMSVLKILSTYCHTLIYVV